ncbi:A/G-specific adenine glycosylase [Sulfuriferula thiophila]|uniref:A/G-specific adenine glycosylase n=1 Tax=Sulfuriferula thiophila TaxID=1781211 RepID=UPI000F611E76|nr:A/G-specific adenine glycosylase [Sulfuriferula thiophila]
MSDFAVRLIDWQRRAGRHDLPWQGSRDPYRVWLSEIMLQQTQVLTVIPYYQRFVERFADVASLAAAEQDEVLAYWSGLGYYSRARNLHAAARRVMADFDGVFPVQIEQIVSLPGIGRSTAAAIAAFCFDTRAAILDGNVKRVLTRQFGIAGYPGEKAIETRLWALAEALLPASGVAVYTQALMDMGATLCGRSRPRCEACPVAESCVALATQQVASLPTPKPKKSVPHKTVRFVILQHAGRVWLEQRPSSGIWGGLWSFPELAMEEDALAVCCDNWRLQVGAMRQLPDFRHVFSHFSLQITPQLVEVLSLPLAVNETGGCWVQPEVALGMGIPAPVRKVLAAIDAI